MKIFVTAIALAIAAPAAAQTAPTGQQHQDHAQHRQHGSSGQAGHRGQQGQQESGQHDQHQGHGMQSGCCADRNGNGRMDCCEGMTAGSGGCCRERPAQPREQQPAAPQAHPNH
jgi:hypothetical protein